MSILCSHLNPAHEYNGMYALDRPKKIRANDIINYVTHKTNVWLLVGALLPLPARLFHFFGFSINSFIMWNVIISAPRNFIFEIVQHNELFCYRWQDIEIDSM